MTSVPIGMDASVEFAETSVGSRKFGRKERKPSTRIEHPGDFRGDRSTRIGRLRDFRGVFRRKSNVSATFAATSDENRSHSAEFRYHLKVSLSSFLLNVKYLRNCL